MIQSLACYLHVGIDTDSNRAQNANIITSSTSQPQVSGNLSRPTQITLSTTPLLAQTTVGTTYHVPRGPAVVANLAAPRSNVTTVRAPMVVTAQSGQVNIQNTEYTEFFKSETIFSSSLTRL